jgi:metal-sulfur cluster biosynthetic enzyme
MAFIGDYVTSKIEKSRSVKHSAVAVKNDPPWLRKKMKSLIRVLCDKLFLHIKYVILSSPKIGLGLQNLH